MIWGYHDFWKHPYVYKMYILRPPRGFYRGNTSRHIKPCYKRCCKRRVVQQRAHPKLSQCYWWWTNSGRVTTWDDICHQLVNSMSNSWCTFGRVVISEVTAGPTCQDHLQLPADALSKPRGRPAKHHGIDPKCWLIYWKIPWHFQEKTGW